MAAPGPRGVLLHMLDSANGVSQARVQDVRLYVWREVELLDVTQSVEPALPGLVDIAEQAVLPQDGGEVRFLLEVLIRHFLQSSEVLPGNRSTPTARTKERTCSCTPLI